MNQPPKKSDQKNLGIPSKKLDATKKDCLNELIALVTGIAKRKGWTPYLFARDEKEHGYATVSVSRRDPNQYQEITGTFEISCNEKIRISCSKTSFYSWGLQELQEAIGNELKKLPWIENKKEPTTSSIEPATAIVEKVLRRFRQFARQLQHRHDERAPFNIADEYDVQDALHAILRGLFDDVRAEEYVPSYAGGASRMDFLLKTEQIVLEVKFATTALRDKQIGEQLIIDIAKYQAHPDCKRLICFVYDPSGHIKNPAGLESDLSKKHEKMSVKVIVVSS